MAYTLITGASSGLGSEFARLAAKDGHDLILVARNATALNKLAQELHGIHSEVIVQDLSQPGSAAQLVTELHRRDLSVDNLVNNAGFGDYGDFATSDPQRQEDMLMLNVGSLTLLTRLLLPGIIKAQGGILNIGSVASFVPGPAMSVYFASKAYVLNFSLALREELKTEGVAVTCLCPGPTATGFAQAAHVGKDHAVSRSTVSAADVAVYGWQALKTNRAIAVPGIRNKLTTYITRLLPRTLMASLVHRVNK